MKTLAVILILSVVSFFMFLVAKGSKKQVVKEEVLEEKVKEAIKKVPRPKKKKS